MKFLSKTLGLIFLFICLLLGPMHSGTLLAASPQSAQKSSQQPGQVSSSAAIEINPSRFELLLAPQGKSVQSMKITNRGKEPVTFTVEAKDWDLPGGSNPTFAEPAPRNQSASAWLRFNPRQFTVAPGETQYVRFSMTVPPNCQPGEYRTALLLTTEQEYSMQDGIYYKPTFAVLIYANLPKITRAGEMTGLKLLTSENGNHTIAGEIRSTGNAHLRLSGQYSIENSSGAIITEGALTRKVILPDRSDSFAIALDQNLPSGKYKIKVIWNYVPAIYMEGKLNEYPLGQKSLTQELTFSI